MRKKYIVVGVLFLAYCFWQYNRLEDPDYLFLAGGTIGALAVYIGLTRPPRTKVEGQS